MTWLAWAVAIGALAAGFVIGVVAMSLAAASAQGDRMHSEALRRQLFDGQDAAERRERVLELVARLQGPGPHRGVVRCLEPGCGWEADYLDPHTATHLLKTHRYASHGVPWGT